jgi:hypothetical protein
MSPLPQTPPATKDWQAALAWKGGFPADAQIAVSSTHVVVTNRMAMAYFDRDGGALGTLSAVDFFKGLGLNDGTPTAINRYNDLRAVFDAYRHRFWVAATGGSTAKLTPEQRRPIIAVGVSMDENPLHGWHLYYWDAVAHWGQPNDPVWQPGDAVDYPILGIDPLAVTVTNMVVGANGAYKYWHVALFPADTLASGQAGSLSGWQYWDLTNPDGSVAGLIQPAVHHGTTGRAYYVSRQGTDSLVVWGLTDPFKPTRKLIRTAVQMPLAWTNPVNAPQKGSAKTIKMTNSFTNPLKAVCRNPYLYVATNDARAWGGGPQTLSSIRLVRLPLAKFPAILTDPQAGFISRIFGGANPLEDNEGSYFYYSWPAVEVNKNGDMVLVYARTGQTIYPEVRFSVYLHNESDIRPSRLLKGGDAAYDIPNYNDPNNNPILVLPWGDTAGACVDPTDDTAVWVAQEYASATANNNGNYDIWVGRVFS